MLQLFREIRANRELIWALAMKDLRVRYKRSVLGFLWALLNPLLTMVILTAVFSQLIAVPNYAVFIISALLPWTFFSQALWYALESIVSNGELLKKVYIAKSVFPVAAILSNVLNFFFSLGPMILILLLLRFPFHATWLYLPVPLLGLVLFTMGCGFFFAAANVFFRDVAHVVQIALGGWFYLTPVMYPETLWPEKYRPLFRLNPMLYFLHGFRLSIYDGRLPQLPSGVLSLAIGLLALIAGYAFFSSQQEKFVYYV